MGTTAVTDTSFDADVLKSDVPVVVDFWATWCGPCKMIAPALEELSDELAGKVKIVKIDIDEHPDTPGRYGVRGIPTMILFKDGEVAATQVGAMPKSGIRSWVEGALAKSAAA
jgi:thioredoxin 1